MKQIAFIFSIILLLCSCKSSESTNSNITLFQEKDIYTTGRIDTLMLKSKYFNFKRKVFVRLPPSYPYYDAQDFDVIYTTDAQTMEEFSWHALGLCFKRAQMVHCRWYL